MEIVRQGRLPEEKTYCKTCYSCKTVFKFKGNECTISCNPMQDTSTVTVECPFCKKILYFTM